MLNDSQADEVIQALDRYYGSAKPDDDHYNQGILAEDIARHGEILVNMGLPSIIVWLRKYLQTTMLRVDEDAADNEIVSFGWYLVKRHCSLVRAFGERGIQRLVLNLGFSDEDSIALAAFELGYQFIRPSSIFPLKLAYKGVEGTACKLAIAYALFRHEEKDALRDLANSILVNSLGWRMLSMSIKQYSPNISEKELIDATVLEAAFPGSSGYVPEHVSSQFTRGVFWMMIMDMATDGAMYEEEMRNGRWKRKQYEDE